MQLYEAGADGNVAFTSVSTAISGSVQTVTLAYPSRHIVISSVGTTTLFVTLDGSTPTSANFQVTGGQALSMDGLPAITIVKLLGSVGSGSLSILAW